MNNSVFGKTMENERKIATTERKRTDFLSEPNFHATKFFIENLLSIEMRKTQTLITQTVYLGLSILDLIKTVMYEFWYDYAKPKLE